jgi:2-oxoglutarate ferredoxin oxidoreductase subunit beta
MIDLKEYESDFENKWCPGCGNFGILKAMKAALAEQDLPPDQILIISGIGQASKTPHFLKCNAFHGLHGRALPVATGAKLANHDLKILVNMGDGDCYGEGGNHFLHAVRRNIDLTLLVHNNKVYGLTRGQASPTSDFGLVTRAQPHGVISGSFNPLMVALALNASFVARGFSGNIEHLSQLIQEGFKHKGLSLIDILQPCVSFNHVNTHKWYADRVYNLEKEGYSQTNHMEAMAKAQEWGDRIPIGIVYKEERPSFVEQIPSLKEGALLDRKYDPNRLRNVLAKL